MADKQESILRRVQALIAKADATPFEHEADAFRAKADELMTKYVIEEWQLNQLGRATSSLDPIRRDMSIAWWYEVSQEIDTALWSMFWAVMTHCRVVIAYKHPSNRAVPVFGLEMDLNYSEMLFTSLMLQMSKDMVPIYDPNLTMGHNVANAKKAGMNWQQIADWMGQPELFYYSESEKRKVGPVMIREYRKHIRATGEKHVNVNPKQYQRSYALGWTGKVNARLRSMRTAGEQSSDDYLPVLRDVTQKATDEMLRQFPDQATTGTSRSINKSSAKINTEAWSKGMVDGEKAAIDRRDPKLTGQRKELK